jgi:RNA polymerase sigma-70 factor, ECF subfamily
MTSAQPPEGYKASAGPELVRTDLCVEAIRLARVLSTLMPDEPETAGLLALMLFQHSRRLARVDEDGELVTLEEQDRSRWDRSEIDEAGALLAMARGPEQGLVLVDELVASGELGGYHLLHATRADLLRRLGRTEEAQAAYTRALELTSSDVERRFLTRRLAQTARV